MGNEERHREQVEGQTDGRKEPSQKTTAKRKRRVRVLEQHRDGRHSVARNRGAVTSTNGRRHVSSKRDAVSREAREGRGKQPEGDAIDCCVTPFSRWQTCVQSKRHQMMQPTKFETENRHGSQGKARDRPGHTARKPRVRRSPRKICVRGQGRERRESREDRKNTTPCAHQANCSGGPFRKRAVAFSRLSLFLRCVKEADKRAHQRRGARRGNQNTHDEAAERRERRGRRGNSQETEGVTVATKVGGLASTRSCPFSPPRSHVLVDTFAAEGPIERQRKKPSFTAGKK